MNCPYHVRMVTMTIERHANILYIKWSILSFRHTYLVTQTHVDLQLTEVVHGVVIEDRRVREVRMVTSIFCTRALEWVDC